MPPIRRLQLQDLDTVHSYLRRYPPEISELTFTNLFVWRHSRPIFFAEIEDSLVFVTATKDGKDKYIFGHPLGESAPLRLAAGLGVPLAGFIRVPQGLASLLAKEGLLTASDRDHSDYVYRVEDLAELAGRRYHKKRNLIKQCLTGYSCQYEPITSKVIPECLNMQERWCQRRRCGREPGLCREYVAVREMFHHFAELGLLGGAVRIEGKIQAFAVGEELNPTTAVWHFEKAMAGFRGLGQLINHWFAKYALGDFRFVNREQDLGHPGLRRAKKSYYPHHMVDKFNAWLPAAAPVLPTPLAPLECEE